MHTSRTSATSNGHTTRVIFVANWDWVLAHFRLPLAKRLREEGYEVIFCCPDGEHVRRLKNAGFEWVEWSLSRRSMVPTKELRAVRDLARIIGDTCPDITHAFTIKPVLYMSLISLWSRFFRSRRRPEVLINNLTGLGFLFSNDVRAIILRILLWPVLLTGLRQSRAWTVLMNEGDLRRLRFLGLIDPDRTRVVEGTGVDMQRFSPREHQRQPVRHPTVLFAARLLREKGVDDYVAAAEIVRSRGVDAEFLVAGRPDNGNPNAIPEHRVRELDAIGVIRWLDHVDDMASLLRDIDVVVVPTYYPEGAPRVLIEGAASGCALVASDTPACRVIVSHGENGFLVPVRDPEAIADAIHRLSVDESLRVSMGGRARSGAVERFEIEEINDRWLRIYESVLARAAP